MLRWVPLLLVCVGCATRPPSPRETLRQFARALRSGDAEVAYALLSDDYRRRVPLSEFERRLHANADEVSLTLDALDEPREEIEITARAHYGDGDDIELVMEADGFHIRGDITDFYPQDTPAHTARSFVRAMRRERYDVVLRFVPQDEREGVTVESLRATATGDERDHIAEMLVALDAQASAPFEVHGSRATLAYGGGRTLRLLQEEGVWRIASPE